MRNMIYDSSEAYDMEDYYEDYLEDEVMNLNVNCKGKIALVGKIARWNGVFPTYKILDTCNIGKSMVAAVGSFDGNNTFEIFVEDGKMMLHQYGHDNPTNPSAIEFRELKPGVDEFDLENTDDIIKNSLLLADRVCQVYGWTL